MRPDQWDQVQALLDRAAEVEGGERRRFIEEHCDDEEVRGEVLSLMGYGAEEFLGPEHLPRLAGIETQPESVGPYRVTRVLGEGGMGVVYQATQSQPVERTVAIKVIKLGMDTREVVARFDTERQALAMMTHPNIARVYDAGATETGRPYFVMEYVDGASITDHCDEHRLGTRERLELFEQVCRGIQHAHQKGIIHRDIKPSNILVASRDGTPTPTIIDFGIAKATDRSMNQATLLTQAGQIVGTLAYMSPEQVSMTGHDVDIRTDVYSLGVLLYELLVGRLPFDTRQPDLAFDEICRQIRETDPPRPSTQIKAASEETNRNAERRQTDPTAFLRDLRGDLDWIVMKALEKQPDRRYASVSEFAADVQRYLGHEPVVARPPSATYRLRKFARRHRAGVASAVVIGGLLVAGTIGTTVGLIESRRSERRARQEAQTAEALAGYFVDIFRSADPEEGRSITAQEILDSKARTVRDDEALAGEPGIRGRVMSAMGEAYMGLGLFGNAISLMEEALPLLRASYGDESEEVYNLLNELGQQASKVGDYEAAQAYHEEALTLAERTVGPDHFHIPPIANKLGAAYRKLGDPVAARRYLDLALERRIALYGTDNMGVAKVLGSLSQLAVDLGDFDQAMSLAERSLEIRRSVLPPEDQGIGYGHFFLADVETAAGEHDSARENYEAALANWEQSLRPDHENVRAILLRLARSHLAIGDANRAYVSYERSLAITRSTYPVDDPNLAPPLARFLDEYADFLDELDRDVEAGELRAEAAGLRQRNRLSP